MTGMTAFIVTDPYNEFLHPEGKLNAAIAEDLAHRDAVKHLQALLKSSRANKIPVYYGLHQQTKAGFLLGWNHATPNLSRLEPDVTNGDVIVSKHWCSSSFQNTDLDYQLRQRDTTHLVLTGMVANTCLESTIRYAYELGYSINLIKDATAGFTKEQSKVATEVVWPIFAHKVTTTAEWIQSLPK